MTHPRYLTAVLLALAAGGCAPAAASPASAPEGPQPPANVPAANVSAANVPAANGECAKSARLDTLVRRLEQQLPTLAACDSAEERDGVGIPLVVILQGDGSIAARAVQPGRAPKSWACFAGGISSLHLEPSAGPTEWLSSEISF